MATIELKSSVEELRGVGKFDWDKREDEALHDALASHCYRQAIEERRVKYANGSLYHDAESDPNVKYLRSIESRAAELLRQYLDQSGDR